MTEAIMAVWTTGSARGTHAFWSWLKRRLPFGSRSEAMPLDEMPDALCRDVAMPEVFSVTPRDEVWARIAAGKLPRL
jgi:hypothetical protein